MPNSPDVNNYVVSKAEVWFTEEGGTRRHLGNVPEASLELNVETLDHYSSMEGVKSKDFSVVVQKGGTVRLVMEEFNFRNMALWGLGDVSNNTDGEIEIEILAADVVRGQLEVIATNSVGPKWNWLLPQVAFKPSGAISPISDEWNRMEITGELESKNGSFGKLTLVGSQSETE